MDVDDSAASAVAAEPVTVVFVGGSSAGSGGLQAQVEAVAARFGGRVEVRACSDTALEVEHPAVHAVWGPGGAPVIFVLRGGAIVGQAAGAQLPAHELDRVIRRAVEWAHG